MSNSLKPLVSVVIPTYNRYKYLLRAIDSIRKQTYLNEGGNIEIIVVNDKSTDKQYYDMKEEENLKIIHLEKNTKELFGYACAGYGRTIGVNNSNGKYIAFLDDDDWWVPEKIEKQVKVLEENKDIKFCCTDGFSWKNGGIACIYNKEGHWEYLKNKMKLDTSFPSVWTKDFLQIHNTVVTSSVMCTKELLTIIKGFNIIKNGQEDYDCWLRCLDNTNAYYIDDPLFFYDTHHGDGQNY